MLELPAGPQFKRLFVKFACGSLMCLLTRFDDTTNIGQYIEDVDGIKDKNWTQHVRIFLCKQLAELKPGSKYIGGCLFFIMFRFSIWIE